MKASATTEYLNFYKANSKIYHSSINRIRLLSAQLGEKLIWLSRNRWPNAVKIKMVRTGITRMREVSE